MRIFSTGIGAPIPNKAEMSLPMAPKKLKYFVPRSMRSTRSTAQNTTTFFCRVTAFFNAFRSSFASSFLRAAKPSARRPIRRPAPYKQCPDTARQDVKSQRCSQEDTPLDSPGHEEIRDPRHQQKTNKCDTRITHGTTLLFSCQRFSRLLPGGGGSSPGCSRQS